MRDRIAMLFGPLGMVGLLGFGAFLAVGAVLAAWTGPGAPWAGGAAIGVLLTSGPVALAWLGAAAGYGRPLARLLVPGEGFVIELALGVAALLVADAALGALGALQWAGGALAWGIVLAGLTLAVNRRGGSLQPFPAAAWAAAPAAAPAVAVLVLAACSAPGWLWASEFGGYDALSYHLELPKEWLALGRIEPLEHNVYSFLPGYVEAAYYHLAVLMGDGLAAAPACQLLHAGLALATAAATGRAAQLMVGRSAGGVAAAIVLGVPWVIVVGSLAYNEMAVAFMLAAGLVIVLRGACSWRSGAALGLVCGAACGCKLTALGLAALPLVAAHFAWMPPRRWARPALAAAVAGAIALIPWLARNGAHAGNPLFPFATELLGTAHWSAGQAHTFMEGHDFDGGAGARIAALFNEVLRYGIGPRPDPGEPWAPQWSILPWLALAGLAVAGIEPRRRAVALRLAVVLAVQAVFWIAFTHMKSRFLVPAVVPGALAVVLGGAALVRRESWTAPMRAALAIALIAWCSVPVAIFAGERAPAARVGQVLVPGGEALTPAERREMARLAPAVMINHELPPGARVLLVGDATPLYYEAEVAYRTTWDRGPLSRAMDGSDRPAAWLERLRADGFTHVLVNPTMLDVWERAGWNDPRITSGVVLAAMEAHAELVAEFPDGSRLYRLRPP